MIFALIPPSVRQWILPHIGTGSSNGSQSVDNSTLNIPNWAALNSSAGLDLNVFYDASIDWPILSYFARLAGHFLSRARGLPELFSNLPTLREAWRVFLRGLLRKCSKEKGGIDFCM